MLLSVKRLTKLGGGSVTLSSRHSRATCTWRVDPAIAIELERDKWPLFSWYVVRVNTMDVLPNAHGHLPTLCYNGIIHKWFCLDRTKYGYHFFDATELKALNKAYDSFSDCNGFCDSPVDAIARWNISAAMELMCSTYENCYE